MATEEDRERLRSHFAAGNTPNGWDELWQRNFTPWDRSEPNPALRDILSGRSDLFNTSGDDSEHQKKRALVPGCGKGYDVLLLASFGYDAYGVDGSETALKEARKLVETDQDKYPLQPGVKSRGVVKFVLGDFFSSDWEAQTGFSESNRFDIIYDYTFLCALPPSTRPSWAAQMVRLLSPNGRLICLEFPSYKDPKTGGPPFGVREAVYVEHLKRPGQDVEYDDDGFVVSSDKVGPNSLIRIERYMPERTHAIGKGTDWISIWTHSSHK